MTTALEGGEGSASRPGRSLPPRKTRYPLYRRPGGTYGRSGQVRKISLTPGFDPRTVQPLASHYNVWATRPTNYHNLDGIFCKVHRIIYLRYINLFSSLSYREVHILFQSEFSAEKLYHAISSVLLFPCATEEMCSHGRHDPDQDLKWQLLNMKRDYAGIRSPGRPARSQLLYRLSYPAHTLS